MVEDPEVIRLLRLLGALGGGGAGGGSERGVAQGYFLGRRDVGNRYSVAYFVSALSPQPRWRCSFVLGQT